MKTKMKRKAKGSRKANTTRDTASVTAPENGEKKTKRFVIQGIHVLTPGGKKPGKRGAAALLKLSQIKVVKGFNPRTALGETAELEKSIRKNGLLHPLVVRPAGDGKTYQLVAGERRHAALKSLGLPWTDSVPVNIRVDLEGDDLAAQAVAIAENSEDGRQDLSYIEIGNVASEMVKQKWPVARIASETGINQKKIQRAISLVGASEEIIKRVQSGELGPTAALEITKLAEDQQEAVLAKVGPGATVVQVRKVRKAMENEERRLAIAQGADKKTKNGTARERAPTSWQNPRAKQPALRMLCYALLHDDDADKNEKHDGWYQLRGAIGYALWDRGDLESPVVPSIHSESEDNPDAAKKVNVIVDRLIKAEASLHKPDEEEEEIEEEAEADEAEEGEEPEAKPKGRRKKAKSKD